MKQIGFTLMLIVVVLSPLAAVCQGFPDGSPATPAANPQEPATEQPAQISRSPSRSDGEQAAGRQASPSRSVPLQTTPSEAKPLPLTPPDGQWRKIQRVPAGTAIEVSSTYGPALRCRFAGASDDALYCDAPESPDGTGWVFERPAVISVRATILRRNHHPAWIASMIGGGIVVGLAATGRTSAGRAAGIGAIGALVTGAIGTPLAMSTPDTEWVTVVYWPRVSRVRANGLPEDGGAAK